VDGKKHFNPKPEGIRLPSFNTSAMKTNPHDTSVIFGAEHFTHQDWHRLLTHTKTGIDCQHTPRLASTAGAKRECDKMMGM
jgi:hypothetical protein